MLTYRYWHVFWLSTELGYGIIAHNTVISWLKAIFGVKVLNKITSSSTTEKVKIIGLVLIVLCHEKIY
jgi:hypothetical protein